MYGNEWSMKNDCLLDPCDDNLRAVATWKQALHCWYQRLRDPSRKSHCEPFLHQHHVKILKVIPKLKAADWMYLLKLTPAVQHV